MRILSRLLAILAAVALTIQPAAAQRAGPSVLRDAETERLLQDMVDPLAEAAGLGEGAVEVILVNDGSINAFVAGGQRIFIHSGLINAADTANEVQGVLAHELGHITGGHVNRMSEGVGQASKISLLTMLAGVAAALAGAGDAGMGLMAMGQQAAMSRFLSFSRTQESSADAAGAEYLSEAGITGKGSLEFFRKLRNLEFRYAPKQIEGTEFMRTHPMSEDRIATLREVYERDPAWETAPDSGLQERFERAKAKLFGFLAEPERTYQAYPEHMNGVPARYARAYAFHKDARIDKALAEADALIASEPDNPFFLELKGQVLLESGRPEDAIEPLRKAVRLTGNEPLIASSFGHALIATENPAHLDEAETVLKAAVARDNRNPFAWYQLGIVYSERGDLPRARLASAEQQMMQGNTREALVNARSAQAGLPEGTPDWIRAQDVALAARAQLEREEKRN
jgi:predicted Zn-dependent protease